MNKTIIQESLGLYDVVYVRVQDFFIFPLRIERKGIEDDITTTKICD